MEAAVASNKPEEFVEALLKTVADPASAETLKRLKELLSKSASLLGTRVSNLERDCIDLAVESSEVFHSTYPDVQFLEPRGRFTLKFSTNTIVVDGKGGNGSIPVNKVTHLCLLPSHTSSKKEGEDYLVVIFSEPIKICGKPMTSLLLNLSKSLPKLKPGELPPEEGSEAAMTESRRIGLAFKNATGVKVHLPNPRLFTSVAQQRAFLRCHKGVNEGAIYPISCGMVFIKPLIFIGTDEIASFTAGRGGGSGNTRFVDIQIETTKDVNYEFSNIDREELAALNAYVKGFLEARRRKMDEAAGSSTATASSSSALLQQLEQEGDDDDDDSDDDEDEDYEEDADSSSDDGQGSASGGSDSDSDDSDLEEAASNKKKKTSKKNDTDDEKDSDDEKEKPVAKKTTKAKANAQTALKKEPKVEKEKKTVDAGAKKVGKAKDTAISLVKEENKWTHRPVVLSTEVDLVSEEKPTVKMEDMPAVKTEDISGKKRSISERESVPEASTSTTIVLDDAVQSPSLAKKIKTEAITESTKTAVPSSQSNVVEIPATAPASTPDVPNTTTAAVSAPPSQPKKNTLFAAWGQKPKSATFVAASSSGDGNHAMDVDEKIQVTGASSEGGLEIIEV